jgi:hypothetical protein
VFIWSNASQVEENKIMHQPLNLTFSTKTHKPDIHPILPERHAQTTVPPSFPNPTTTNNFYELMKMLLMHKNYYMWITTKKSLHEKTGLFFTS